jgi:hypothetical protein
MGAFERAAIMIAAIGVCGATAAGCTAAKAQLQIVSAETALHRAEEYEAQKLAVYEYMMASQYLDKAREEAAFSDYRIADALARRSAEWSDRAIIFVERGGRGELDLDVLSDAQAPVPAPAPKSAPVPDTDADDLELDDEVDLQVDP